MIPFAVFLSAVTIRQLAVAVALVALAGCSIPSTSGTGAPVPPVTDVAVVPLAASPQAPDLPPAPLRPVARLEQSQPVGLSVPAIGVRTGPLAALGVDPGGVLEVPPDAATAGWFTLGPTPGGLGPAVVAGHVEHDGAPGVFARLADVAPGDEVEVRRADGTDAVFTAYRVQRFPRSAFPTDLVYGDTTGPELRLITWGGVFDRGDGRFADNVVVFARLAGSR